KYFGGIITGDKCPDKEDEHIKQIAAELPGKVAKAMDSMRFSDALGHIWSYISALNKYIDITMPWALAKDESKQDRLSSVRYNLAEGLRIVSVLIEAVMPDTTVKMQQQLGIEKQSYESILTYGGIKEGTKVCKGEALF